MENKIKISICTIQDLNKYIANNTNENGMTIIKNVNIDIGENLTRVFYNRYNSNCIIFDNCNINNVCFKDFEISRLIFNSCCLSINFENVNCDFLGFNGCELKNNYFFMFSEFFIINSTISLCYFNNVEFGFLDAFGGFINSKIKELKLHSLKFSKPNYINYKINLNKYYSNKVRVISINDKETYNVFSLDEFTPDVVIEEDIEEKTRTLYKIVKTSIVYDRKKFNTLIPFEDYMEPIVFLNHDNIEDSIFDVFYNPYTNLISIGRFKFNYDEFKTLVFGSAKNFLEKTKFYDSFSTLYRHHVNEAGIIEFTEKIGLPKMRLVCNYIDRTLFIGE